jgi:predicted ATPase/class 3 adenylate cyclase
VTQPTGTVTFLFTDVEGSTRLWESRGAGMQAALERHDTIVRGAIERHHGRIFSLSGDSFGAAFSRAGRALAAAAESQRALTAEFQPCDLRIRVRMGLHSGEAQERDGNYFGPPVNEAARIMAAAQGGQVLLSAVTRALVRDQLPTGCRVEDVGAHRLRDVSQPQQLYALRGDGLPDVPFSLGGVDAIPGNLPKLLPAVIGRERELPTLMSLVKTHRLTTVVGPPGTGKTRLAIELARAVARDFPGGAWFVDLAREHDADDVLAAVGRALAVPPERGVSLLETIRDLLRYGRTLLVLDNCETATEPAATVASRLLEGCPQLAVVATSREPLRAPTERVFALEPLATRAADGGLSAAAQLFIERAHAQGASARSLHDDRATVEELCARLDGLPLAIELAAARARALGPRELLAHMPERFRVLTTPSSSDARHRTLRSAIDSSYAMLAERERALFDRLSMLRGPFEHDDALALNGSTGADEFEVIDALTVLVDRSMVNAISGETMTYRLLESLRQYGTERLAARDDLAAVGRRYAEHFAEKATGVRASIVSPRQVAAVDLLIEQTADYRAACAWALDAGDLDLAVLLATTYCGASYFRIGYAALDWLGEDPAAFARRGRRRSGELLGLLSRRAVFGGDMELGRVLAEQSIALDPGSESFQARAQLSLIASSRGDAEGAVEWAKSSLEVALDGHDDLGTLLGLLRTGEVLALANRADEAERIGERTLALGRERRSKHATGWGHLVLGKALKSRDPPRSREHLELATDFGRAEKNRYLEANASTALLEATLATSSAREAAAGAVRILERLQRAVDLGYFTRRGLGSIAVFLAEHAPVEAARLEGHLGNFSFSSVGPEVERRHNAVERLRQRLGDSEFAKATAEGARLSSQDAIALADDVLSRLAEIGA